MNGTGEWIRWIMAVVFSAGVTLASVWSMSGVPSKVQDHETRITVIEKTLTAYLSSIDRRLENLEKRR